MATATKISSSVMRDKALALSKNLRSSPAPDITVPTISSQFRACSSALVLEFDFDLGSFPLSADDPELNERWGLVHQLRSAGDEETFVAAKKWCDSKDGAVRELAADLLGQLGQSMDENGDYVFPFMDRAVPLLERLIDDLEFSVVASAISSLGFYDVLRPITARTALLAHQSTDVRLALADSFSGAISKDEIDFLISLSTDEVDIVRDSATFKLARQSDFDTSDIRGALLNRLDDTDLGTRSEALVGLARRKDIRALPAIRTALVADSVSELAIEAAGYMLSPALAQPLEKLLSWWDEDTELLEAVLRRCKGCALPDDAWRWKDENDIVVPNWATGGNDN